MSQSNKFMKSFKRHRKRWLFVLLLVFAFTGFILTAGNYYNQAAQFIADKTNKIVVLPKAPESPFMLGLDLQGGTQLIYEADVSSIPEADRLSSLEGVRDIIERRVNVAGVSEPLVQINRTLNGDYRILAELAGIKDVNEAIRMIGETPLLEFKEQNFNDENIVLEPNEEALMFNEEVSSQAKEALESLKLGADWIEVASRYQLEVFNRDDINASNDPELSQALGALNISDIVASPVITNDNLIIAKLLEKKNFADPFQNGSEDQPDDFVYSAQLLVFPLQDASPSINLDNAWSNTELSGKNLSRAVLQFNPQNGSPEVSLEFDAEGAQMFADITERNIGSPVAIFLDGYAISVPTVNERIPDGKAIISGQFNVQEAKLLVQRLNTGALPVPIHLIGQQTVGASLGQKSIINSVNAGLIGLFLVALFMILFYRLPGVVAVVSLLIYAVTVLTIFKSAPLWLALLFILLLVVLFVNVFDHLKIFDGAFSILFFLVILAFLVYYANQPVTLTLAGITGFILSIGMAVDANILIFERIKEELKTGKPLSAALDEGFKRAWPSIRDGNITTILTCFVLMGFGTGLVKGFGATLFIGVSISMFSSIVITYILLNIFNRSWLDKNRWILGGSAKIKK
jgi:protein-export membrane protein SecD